MDLRLSGNNLTGIPAELGNCVKIDWFLLDNNKLTTLPGSIVKLNPKDTCCDLGYNRLKSGNISDIVITWLDTYDPDWRDTQDTTYINSLNLNINPFEL